MQSELALEQVLFKMETAELVGDLGYVMHPVKNVLTMIGKHIREVMPEVSYELSQINESLEGVVTDMGITADTMTPRGAPSPEAEKILHEAGTLAEEKIKTRFPELQPQPSSLPAST